MLADWGPNMSEKLPSDDIVLICSRSGLAPEEYVEFAPRGRQLSSEAPNGLRPAVTERVIPVAPAAEPRMPQPRPAVMATPPTAQSPLAGPSRAGLRALFNPGVGPAGRLATSPRLARPVVVAPAAAGMGCTTLVATLGQVYRRRGQRVLLFDERNDGLLALHFGAAGGVTHDAAAAEGSAVAQLIPIMTRESVASMMERNPESWFAESLARHRTAYHWAILDGAGFDPMGARSPAAADSTYLVPVCPDLRGARAAVALADEVEALEARTGRGVNLHFVLNQMDPSRGFQVEVRAHLAKRLGTRLAPVMIDYATDIEESLAEGGTVIDYSPDSHAAVQFRQLADWLTGLGHEAF